MRITSQHIQNALNQAQKTRIHKNESSIVCRSKEEMLKEHKRLVKVLKSKSHKDDKKEAQSQEQSLQDYQKRQQESNDIQKKLKHLLMAGAMGASALTGGSMAKDAQMAPKEVPKMVQSAIQGAKAAPTAIQKPDRKHLLESIAFVESSGGKNLNHPWIQHGPHAGTKAIGKFAFMPMTVKELVGKSNKLKAKHGAVLNAKTQDDMEDYFKKNPKINEDLANHYIDQIDRHSKPSDPGEYHTAWQHGIAGLNKMKESGTDMSTVERYSKGQAAYQHAKDAHEKRQTLHLANNSTMNKSEI